MRRPTLREVGGNGFFHTPFCFGSFYFFLGGWLEVYVCKYILIYIYLYLYMCVYVFLIIARIRRIRRRMIIGLGCFLLPGF